MNKFKWLKNFINIPDNLISIKKDIGSLKDDTKEIREALIARGILQPFSKTRSPKQITERGYNLLREYGLDEFLSKCQIFNENNFEGMKEIEIYKECLNWVEEKEKKMSFKLTYNSPLSQEECEELLALAMRDKILKKEN